jgi:hypothetical protein
VAPLCYEGENNGNTDTHVLFVELKATAGLAGLIASA